MYKILFTHPYTFCSGPAGPGPGPASTGRRPPLLVMSRSVKRPDAESGEPEAPARAPGDSAVRPRGPRPAGCTPAAGPVGCHDDLRRDPAGRVRSLT
eukprot:306858-Hanusia_phi.AAC.4